MSKIFLQSIYHVRATRANWNIYPGPVEAWPINKGFLVVACLYQWMKYTNLPCLPTISATCSELGTGTHSVMFALLFLAVSESIVDDARFGTSSSPFIRSTESSNASCSARWSSGIWFAFTSENMLAGILVVVWLIMPSMWTIWFHKYPSLYGWIFVRFSLKRALSESVLLSTKQYVPVTSDSQRIRQDRHLFWSLIG